MSALETGSSPAPSATLAINEAVAALRRAGRPIVNLGFGEAGLPVLPSVAGVLAEHAARNSYGPVAGTPEARASLAGWFTRRGVDTDPDQIVLAPGSKPLLYALLATLPGDLVLPRPSWVSYAAQAAMVGKHVLHVPIGEQCGGMPESGLFAKALAAARAEGRRPGVLLLTVPDNPTGTSADRETLEVVCDVAAEHELVVIADEIYAELYHDAPAFSPLPLLPERTIVTTGLSKSMALGGWRIGAVRFPSGKDGEEARRAVVACASELWSALAAPMQAAAAYVWSEPDDVRERIARSRRLHGRVAHAVYELWLEHGASCRPPQAGFYLYPALAPRPGIATSTELAAALLEHDIAVLPGTAFGDDDSALRVRVATSLLYGETDEQRLAALESSKPEALPWIAESLTRIRAALAAVAS